MSKKKEFLVVRVNENIKREVKEEANLLDFSMSEYIRKIIENRIEVMNKIK